MGFREGWYLVRRDQRDRKHCRYFLSPERYTAECYIEPNGEQILLWHAQTPAQAKQAQWSSEFEPLSEAPPEDWWDDPATSDGYDPDVPGDYSREQRQPTVRELCMRADTIDPDSVNGLVCTKQIHVGLFFDGTNNNRDRDRPVIGHSNIVSLYDAHREDGENYFRYYIPGVGTPFPEIGEETESRDGKAFGAGGEARIHWGMLEVYNAACSASLGQDLMPEKRMTELVTSKVNGLKTLWRMGDAKLRPIFSQLDEELRTRIKGSDRPRVTVINLSVFGFSRGAAQARAFANWFQQATQGQIGGAAVRLRFIGLFDTVASVGLADSSPVGSGFMDWADGTMEFSGFAAGLHLVSAHEIRRSFPLSTARGRRGSVIPGVREYIYPGAHSDSGGGYAPGDQGKSVGGRSQLLSQIALNDMHFGALNAGAELLRKSQMEARIREDFVVDPALDANFSAYVRWTELQAREEDMAATAKAHVDSRLQRHMQLYWVWRLSKRTDEEFRAMHSYANASAQDRQDLWDAEGDWRADVERAGRAARLPSSPRTVRNPVQVTLHRLATADPRPDIPVDVDTFFDRFVHDSHAGFYLLGPLGEYERRIFAEEVHAKQASYDRLMRRSNEASDMELKVAYAHQAERYRLNNFERRVVALQPDEAKDRFPVMSDADAADLRTGFSGLVVRYGMGTGTRREANGHGQYRRIFDRS